MLKEMIDTVKKAESDAEEKIKQAKLEASANLEKTAAEAENYIIGARAKAKEVAENRLKDAEKERDKAISEALSTAKAEAEKLKAAAPEKQADIDALVMNTLF